MGACCQQNDEKLPIHSVAVKDPYLINAPASAVNDASSGAVVKAPVAVECPGGAKTEDASSRLADQAGCKMEEVLGEDGDITYENASIYTGQLHGGIRHGY